MVASSAAARTRIFPTRRAATNSSRRSRPDCRKSSQDCFPDLDTEPQFAWAGSFGTTTTGLPYIGRVPRHPRVLAVMGYGGNGISYSQVASEVVASAIQGREDSDARLFAF